MVTLPFDMENISNPFFASDQKEPSIALAFFAKKHNDSREIANPIIVSLNLETNACDFIYPELLIPDFKLDYHYNLPVYKLQSFLLLATGKTYNTRGLPTHLDLKFTNERFKDCRNYISFTNGFQFAPANNQLPYLLTFAADGTICILGKESMSRKSPIKSMGFKKNKNDWHMNEILISGEDAIVMQMVGRPNSGHGFARPGNFHGFKVLYSASMTRNLELNWFIDLNQVENLMVPSTNRAILHCAFDFVILSDSDEMLLLSKWDGTLIKRVMFPIKTSKERHVEHTFEDVDPDEQVDYNPYAQSGSGLYELANFGLKFMAIHDLERFYPLAFDFIEVENK